ncbi:MAG: hypothetical protein U0457_21700 [Candidatus Sericytochromatia bacterium]
MAENNVDLVIDLEKSDDDLVKDIVKVLKKSKDEMTEKGEVALNFLVKKKGENPQPFVYNFNKDSFFNAEKSYIFPKVIEEIVKKEFNPKIAKDEKLLKHIIDELKNDPYWSGKVVELVKSLREKSKD